MRGKDMSETIFRVEKNAENPYVMIDKNVFEDTSLSFKAKGILGYLLSRPNDWTLIIADIQKRSTDGKDSVKNGIDELIERGYIVKTEQPRQAGKFATCDYVVYEKPINTGVNRCGKTVADKPSRINRHGKSATTNNNKLNNNKLNNELLKKDISSGTPKKQKPKSASLEKPCDVSDQTWHDLLALRKAKKSPLTISAWNIAKKQIDEAQAKTGHTLEQVLLVWIERGWQGFMAKWYFNHINAQNTQNTQGNHNAINQPTYSPNHQQPVKSDVEIYRNKLMAEYDAFYGTTSKSAGSQGFSGNVYDLEKPV